MKQSDFSKIKDVALGVLAQSGNCEASQREFYAAQSVPELAQAWQHFWAGAVTEVPEQVVEAFAEHYAVYREGINAAGWWYNEQPPTTVQRAQVLIGKQTQDSLRIEGRHKVYVLSTQPVIIGGNCGVYVNCETANVVVTDSARCNIKQGMLTAYKRAVVNGSGNMECHDSATVYITGGTLYDYGHLNIIAYNDACVFTKAPLRRIKTEGDNVRLNFFT